MSEVVREASWYLARHSCYLEVPTQPASKGR
jgi:hypothetical protein